MKKLMLMIAGTAAAALIGFGCQCDSCCKKGDAKCAVKAEDKAACCAKADAKATCSKADAKATCPKADVKK